MGDVQSHETCVSGVTSICMQLGEHQRVNHFPNHYELTRKDLLTKNVKKVSISIQFVSGTVAGLCAWFSNQQP